MIKTQIHIRAYLVLSLSCLLLTAISASAQTKQEIVDAWQQQIESFQTLQLDYDLSELELTDPLSTDAIVILKYKFALSRDKYYSYLEFPRATDGFFAKASAYDGYYYQKLIEEKGKVTVYRTKKEDKSEQPYLGPHPLTVQYGFAFMPDVPHTIGTLKKPETWERLVERITKVQPFTRNEREGFTVDIKIPKSKRIYKVFVDEKTLWPHHWSIVIRSQDGRKVPEEVGEMDVSTLTSVGKKDAALIFPSKIILRGLRNGELRYQASINTVLDSLKINEPIPDAIFTIDPPDATFVDVDKREKEFRARKKYDKAFPLGFAQPTVKVGDNAPDFSVVDSSGEKWDLAKLRGQQNVLLTFYPNCYSGECTNHLPRLRDVYPQLQASNIQVLAVSADPAKDKNGQQEFARYWKLPFPMIPDTERTLSMLYGALQDKKQRPARMTFLIDKSGVVRWIDTNVNIETHGTDMLMKLRELGMMK